jgi:hypothetical protein
VNVNDLAGLARIRSWAGRKAHTDELLSDLVVTLTRNGSTVGSIVCSTLDLAVDALTICCGLRYRRENAAAWAASELALAA